VRGTELSRKILEHHPNIKVVFMTGYSEDQLAQVGVRCGDRPRLAKPLVAKKLAETVRKVLDRTSD